MQNENTQNECDLQTSSFIYLILSQQARIRREQNESELFLAQLPVNINVYLPRLLSSQVT